MSVILPGSRIAILGGGQLGAMLSEAARHMGYKTVVVSDSEQDPAGRWADHHVVADPRDPAIVGRVARQAQVLTVEAEAIPAEALAAAEAVGTCRVAPSAAVQRVVRDRRLEKTFFAANDLPAGPFRIVDSADQMAGGQAELAEGKDRVVAKTARGGYDGKGQRWLQPEDDPMGAWQALGNVPLLLEREISFSGEISVIVARSFADDHATFPVFRNEHRNGILFQTVTPSGFSAETVAEATRVAEDVARRLHVVGLLCVEMFVLADGHVLINELAARPHNSGHLANRATTRSQFEMHIAAICGLPLPRIELLRPAVMTNLLGDLWFPSPPNFSGLFESPSATLHLYGKEPRPGRKCGHMIHTGASAEAAVAAANVTFQRLGER